MLCGRPFRVDATNVPRRRFLHLAAGAAAVPATSRIAMAQAYPTRPVRFIVPFPLAKRGRPRKVVKTGRKAQVVKIVSEQHGKIRR
jgi:hypothetical protein